MIEPKLMSEKALRTELDLAICGHSGRRAFAVERIEAHIAALEAELKEHRAGRGAVRVKVSDIPPHRPRFGGKP